MIPLSGAQKIVAVNRTTVPIQPLAQLEVLSDWTGPGVDSIEAALAASCIAPLILSTISAIRNIVFIGNLQI